MPDLPHHAEAVIAALQFRDPDRAPLRKLTDAQWRQALTFCDAMHLTLSLHQAGLSDCPEWVEDRLARNQADNCRRFDRITAAYRELADALRQENLDHVVLKGFAQWPGLMDPRSRPQSDIDLYFPDDSVHRARESALSLGYRPVPGLESRPSDHLPTMVRENGWKWRGNFFDPEMPPSLELHFRFWNKELNRLGPASLPGFWLRRRGYQMADFGFPGLDMPDGLAFACLHLLRHLLQDVVLTYHVYELAWFLHHTAQDETFWLTWQDLHDDKLRSLQAVCFRLAADWFHCDLPPRAAEQIAALSVPVQCWFQQCGRSPLMALFRPNKDPLWLHVALLESARDKRSVIRERLIPTRRPPPGAAAIQDYDLEGNHRKRHVSSPAAKYLVYVSSRAAYHVRILPSTLISGIRCWWSQNDLGKEYWKFYSASFLFALGMFVFFFLFNLFLLDRGLTEKSLGLIASMLAAGSIAGTIPAGFVSRRIGFRRTILGCFVLTSSVSALRTVSVGMVPQLGLAFLAGLALSIWAVCISPAVAQLTTERNRPLGFSLIFASGIGVGAIGGIFAGALPLWLSRLLPTSSPAHLKQTALLFSCAIVALAIIPARHLRFPPPPSAEKKVYPRSPLFLRFLLAIAVWSLVTGALNPFFNVYFARHLQMPVQRIGWIFSGSQLLQVIAVLAAPLIFRRFGLVNGIMYTQIGTAVALAFLSGCSGASACALVYAGYMALQWMSEPGIYTLLMNSVTPAEQSGASALNFFVISIAQALAAAIAGTSLDRFGYPSVLLATAGIAAIAALVFGSLQADIVGTNRGTNVEQNTAEQGRKPCSRAELSH